MTPIQQLHDEIMGLQAQLAGKRLELAFAQSDAVGVGLWKESMYQTIKARAELRALASHKQTEQWRAA